MPEQVYAAEIILFFHLRDQWPWVHVKKEAPISFNTVCGLARIPGGISYDHGPLQE